VGSVDHVVHYGVFRAQNVGALFFMLGWARCGFHKKCAGTRYAELVFLHPMGSTGHIVDSGASEVETSMYYFSFSSGPGAISIKSTRGHVTSNLCFCIRWDL
jgi:hypothetical protein